MIMPGHNYHFYGLGVEFRPAVYRDLRIHAFVANRVLYRPEIQPDNTVSYRIPDEGHGTLQVNVGVTWKIDFMKYLPERLK